MCGSEGVDQLIAEQVKADEHCSVLFVADSPPAAISGKIIPAEAEHFVAYSMLAEISVNVITVVQFKVD